MKRLIPLLIAASTTAVFAGEHFDRARALYREGPSKSKEIVSELDFELRDHPENMDARLLKAMAQMGINDTRAALKTLGEAAEEDDKAKSIHREIHFLRARCFCQHGDFAAAKKALQPFSAFFTRDPEAKARYDQLMAIIEKEVEKGRARDRSATDSR
jgi:thioredoxin-like negative regulator of GroEL